MPEQEWDVRFTLSGTDYGFMLVKPEGAGKALEISEAPPSQEGHRSDTSYEAFGAQLDTAIDQSSYVTGLGQLEFESGTAAWWGKNIVLHTDGKAYLAPPTSDLTPSSNTTDIAGFYTYYTGTARYDFCWSSTRLYRRPGADKTTNWTLVYTASANITDFVVINDQAYICVPSLAGTTDYLVLTTNPGTTAATWSPTAVLTTTFDASLGKPKLFRQIRGYTFAFVDPRKVFYATDPYNAGSPAWIGPIDTTLTNHYSGAPGDTTYSFQNVVAANDVLIVFKADAGYSIDAQQEITQVLWQWAAKPDPSNFKHVTTMGDLIIYSVGSEVWAYNPNTGANLPFGLDVASGFSVQDIRGIGADNNFVYVGAQVRVPTIRSSATFALFRCWRVSQTRWACECVYEDTTEADPTKYYSVFACPAGVTNATRVYMGYNNATNVVTRIIDFPSDYDASTGSSFTTTGQLYTSIWRGNWPTFLKRWLWLGTQTESLDANNTIACAYSTDLGATWTTIATLSSAGVTISNISGPPSSGSIALRFTFTCAGTTTPVLRTYDLHARPRWRHLKTGTMAIRLGDYTEKLNGTRDIRDSAAVLADLITLRTSDSAITFNSFLGDSFSATIENIGYKPTTHEKPEDLHEMMATVTIAQANGGS